MERAGLAERSRNRRLTRCTVQERLPIGSVLIGAALSMLAASMTHPGSARAQAWDGERGDHRAPFLDNETLSLFRYMTANDGEPSELRDRYWGSEALYDEIASDAMAPLRYLLAFSAYAVAQAAQHTPAYRGPYVEALGGYIERMRLPRAWHDWLDHWGDNPIGPDNIMYTGHLAMMFSLYEQLSGDMKYGSGFELVADDGRRFSTDSQSLYAYLAEQGAASTDSNGEHHFGIACEPGMVFVPCNMPHRLGFILNDELHGTNYAASNAEYMDWLKSNMVRPDLGVLFHLMMPGESPPMREPTLSGLYNGWSILSLEAMDEDFARQLYARYDEVFVRRGLQSTFGAGTATVMDDPAAQGDFLSRALNSIATAFGMSLARSMGDESTYEQLAAGWDKLFGAPAYSQDGMWFYYRSPVYPPVVPNAGAFWARVTSADVNFRSLAHAPFDALRFTEPNVEELSNPGALVNQAYYDRERRELVVTVNGGRSTTEATDIVIGNLTLGEPHTVLRHAGPEGGDVYRRVRATDGGLVITTPPLTADLETYVIRPGAPPPAPDSGSGCTVGARRPAEGHGDRSPAVPGGSRAIAALSVFACLWLRIRRLR